jgi:hypothetical protein
MLRPTGVAVNKSGAGGVDTGDVYVVDSGNNRIDEFSSDGVFVRAFGQDVVRSGGQDNIAGPNDAQAIKVIATGGKFSLEFNGETTGTRGTGDFATGSNIVTNVEVSNGGPFTVGERFSGGGVPPGTEIIGVGAGTLTLSATATATNVLHRPLVATNIPYNAPPASVQAELNSLPVIVAVGGSVAVTGGPGDASGSAPYMVEFVGAFAGDDVPQLRSDELLDGGSHEVSISMVTRGGGNYEVCEASSSPVDICKSGSPSVAAGGLREPLGIAIDQNTGTVFVTDVSNHRINVYSAEGDIEGAFGWAVNASAPEEKLQFCTVATECDEGKEGGGTGQQPGISLRSLPAIASGNGHLYIPEGGNARVEEFAPTFNGSNEVTAVSFVKALGWDVVASGPDQADETQLVTVKAGAGKFKLTYKADTTAELTYNASAAEVQSALEGLSSISSDGFTVTVSGGPGNPVGSAPYKVTFHSTPKGKGAEQLVATKLGLSGGSGESSVKVETYNEGGEGLESCVAANGDVCKEGVSGPHNIGSENAKLGQFSSENPTSVAVASSNGTLYAVNQVDEFPHGPSRVFKFTFPALGAVEASEFAPEQLTRSSGIPSAVNPTDVAVDETTDNVVVAKKEGTTHYKFLEFDSAGNLLFESPPGVGLAVADGGGLAIGNAERFYFSDREGGVDILGPPPPPQACCMAVSDVGSTTATFKGKVTPGLGGSGEHFPTEYHFEYSADGGASWAPFPEADVPIGDGHAGGISSTCPTPEAAECEVSQEVFGLEPSTTYEARLFATDGTPAPPSAPVEFTTTAAAPSITEMKAREITQTSALLTGQLNPSNQETSYRFQWGKAAAAGFEHETSEATLSAAGKAVEVTAPLSGLEEGTAYKFRIVASNPSGTTNGTPDQEFTTLNSFGLPGRAPEQASANDKRPVGRVGQLLDGQIRYQAAADGNSVIFPVLNGLEDATGGGNVEYLGSRGPWPVPWAPTQLTPPALISPIANGVGADTTGRVMYASADLSCQLIESPEPLGEVTPELEDDVAHGIKNLFRRNADGTYDLLSPQPEDLKSPSPFHIDGASNDCNQVLFDTGNRLLAEAPAADNGLYEWDSGSLRLAAIVPGPGAGESVAAGAVAGLGEVLVAPGDGGTYTNYHSLSEDGSTVFFTALSKKGPDLGKEAIFVRKGATETLDASQSQTAMVDQAAHYAMASADGAEVFFLANYGLASNGTSAGAASCNSGGPSGGDGTGCDLYAFDTESKTLSDLSADANIADKKGASVVGVLDASNDGSHIYFAARGQLLPNRGRSEAQNLQGNGTYNVYLDDAGTLSYVGLISAADADKHALSGSDISFKFGHWVADATPDGEALLFVSKAKTSAYPAGAASQVYLYSAATDKTVCVSCRADGSPSLAGVNATPLKEVTQENFSAFTDVQNRPRSLSEDGRHVFFTSPDVLAPGARPNTHNIYEWSAGQTYLLLPGEGGVKDFTEFEDSSPDGKDAFVVTKEKLVPQDFDATTDLYDLRLPHVAGEAIGPGPVEPPLHVCNPLKEECQPPPPPPPPEGTAPASEGTGGEGNPPTEKPKKPPHHHKHKGKGKKHKHHHAGGRAGR